GMLLQEEGGHYLQYQGDGDYFIRGGPGVPENFLANQDIDNTAKGRHDYSTHAGSYNAGDPEWGSGEGHNIIGAVNYLAEQGQNTIYILTNTAGGDGRDVWPWASEAFGNVSTNKNSIADAANSTNGLTVDDFSVFDVSKLAQWEILFDHMDNQGIYKNILLQETENDQLLNGGTPVEGSSLSAERLIYMREMIARFGHANGIQWNMGEENTNTNEQRIDMAEHIKAVDAYDHLTVMHTFPGQIDQVYEPLLGVEAFDGPSFQTGGDNIRRKTQQYLEESAAAGDPWVAAWDEDSSNRGIFKPYGNNPDEANEVKQRQALWGSLTVGGSGVNWYIKQSSGHSFDQNVDTFDAFESVWDWTAAATDFFNEHIPFWEMSETDDLTPDGGDYVMAKAGEYYVAYRPYGEATDVEIDLSGQAGKTFDVYWYNPREGGDLRPAGQIEGGDVRSVADAPEDTGKDWVLFVRNSELADGSPAPIPAPTPDPVPDPDPTPDPVPDPDPTPDPLPEPPAGPGEGEPIFLAQNGQVVIEAESATPEGDWKTATVDGEQALLWDSERSSYGKVPDGQKLTYNFQTDEAGEYHIALHSGRVKSAMNNGDRYENGNSGQERTDTGNDAYVAIVDAATGEVVQSPTKLFTGLGGADRDLKWGDTFDANHKKSGAKVALDANTKYRLEISGRSDGYVLDRITLSNDGFLKDTNLPQSPLKGSTPVPNPDPTPDPDPVPDPNPMPDPDPTPDPNPAPDPMPDPTEALVKFALVDADNNTVVVNYEDLTSGDTIDLNSLDLNKYSIKAMVNPNHPDADKVESVKFETDAGQQIENIEPYALFGDKQSNYSGEVLETGIHKLTATVYSADKAKGESLATVDLSYMVIDSAPDGSSSGSGNDASEDKSFEEIMAPLDPPDSAPPREPVEGITVAVNDSTAEKVDGTADNDTLSLRTYTGTSTMTQAGAGEDSVIIYGSEEIPEGNYHEMLDDLKANPIQTAADYFGATHSVDLGDDSNADSLALVSELGAQPKFMLKHTQNDGRIDGKGVAGENGAAYDHWAGVFGFIDIANFDAGEDTLKLAGHTTKLGESFTQDGDFYQTVYSEQNANDQSGPRAGAAHDDTFLSLLRFEDGAAEADAISDAITVDGMRTFVIKGLGKDIFEDDPTANQVGDTITDEEMFSFTLVNSETDEVVSGYENLTNGAQVDLSGVDLEKFSVVAKVNPDHFYASEVESVKFKSNVGDRTENVDPYTLFSNQKTDYKGKAPELGEVSLTATAYSKNGGGGKAIDSTGLDYAFVDSPNSGMESGIDELTGMDKSGPLTGDHAQPDMITNVAPIASEPAVTPELMTDDPFEMIAINSTDAVATDAAIGTGETDSDAAELDPFGDALPIGTEPSVMEPTYMPT
ncbi:MAG: putative collagen-binding domain-containing protein, partial [Cyanobacteria bacterium P01_C01_bin.120]